MSFLLVEPDLVTAAAANLAGIRSALSEAAAAASTPTTALASAGADEVSAAVSRLFGAYGQQFQALNARAATFHAEFVSLLNGGAAAYFNPVVVGQFDFRRTRRGVGSLCLGRAWCG
nr:PE family protein [Mycobacterium tuberculosis]